MSANNGFLKPVIIGGVLASIDYLFYGERSMQKTLLFASSVAAGVYAAEYVAPSIVPDIPSLNNKMVNGKMLGMRVTEVAVGAGTAYSINRFILKNDGYPEEMGSKLAAIAISDVIGTYIYEYINDQPLEYLK